MSDRQPEEPKPDDAKEYGEEGEEYGEEGEEEVEEEVAKDLHEANVEGLLSRDQNPTLNESASKKPQEKSSDDERELDGDEHKVIDIAEAARLALANSTVQREDKDLKKKIDGKFNVHGKTVTYDRRSLFFIDSEWKIRIAFVWLIEWHVFDKFITAVILGNSVMLAMQDYKGRIYGPDYYSSINVQLEKVDLVFTAIFIFECFCKIIGMGFVWHRNSYLRDAWNWLDFFVVCISLVGFVPNVNSGGLKALRTFRILRPLRTINAIPMMKQQIQSLLAALPGLANILTFLMFVYAIFGIFAVQSFAGNQYQYCRMTKEPTIEKDANGNIISYEWPIVPTFSWLCKNDKDCKKLVQTFGFSDEDDFDGEEIYKCGASIDFGVKAGGKNKWDQTISNEQILFDVVNFNHMGLAFLTIFQSLTMESWTTLMYNYMDSNNVYISFIFFIFLIIFGSFFTMQLVLAEIIDSFTREKENREKERAEAEEAAYHEKIKAEKELAAQLAEENRQKGLEVDQQQEIQIVEPEENKEDEPEVFDDSAFEEETIADRDARRRSHLNCVYRVFFLICINPFFNCFIFMMIMLNTLSLAADDYPMYDKKERIIAYCNQFFTWLFTAEMIIKLIGLGPGNYKKDPYNLFDAIIVTISLIDWTIGMTVGDNVGPAGAVLQAFRAARLLRIIKLARRWTALQDILGKIFESLGELGIFCGLLLLFMYIFALLGMQFFSYRSWYDLDGVIVPVDEILERVQSGEVLQPFRTIFNNIYLSLTSVFCIIFAEDWNWTMYKNIVPFGTSLHYYAVFFIIVFAFGNYVLFALFAAILLSHFDGDGSEEGEDEDIEEEGEGEKELDLDAPPPPVKPNICKRIFSKDTAIAIKNGFIDMFGRKLRERQDETKDPEEKKEQSNEEEQDEQVDEIQNVMTETHMKETKRDKVEEAAGPVTTAGKNQVAAINNETSRSSLEESEAGADADGLLTTKLDKQTSVLLRHYSTDPEGDIASQFVNLDDIEGTVFFIFGKNNPLRLAAARLEKSKGFNNLILLLICISTVNLAVETPLDKPGIMKLRVLQYIDYGMTAAFTFEMSLKIFTYGFVGCGKNSYIRQGWNCLDFLIVCSALIGLNPNSGKSLKSLKTLRILRVLRPLKLASKNKGLKVAITALFKSLPAIGNLQLIIVFFLFLFAILHTTLFAGQFWSCSADHTVLSFKESNVYIKSMWDCINYGGEWVNSDFNYDTTLRSLLTLFCLQSTEGWVDGMWQEVDAKERYMQPVEGGKPFYIIFGILIEILINLLFLNLFVGVVIETFNEEKEKINKNDLLSQEQKKWISVQLMGYQALPTFKQQMTGSACRDLFIKIVEHWLFDGFIMACIIGNTFVLMIKWYAMSDAVINVITNINYAFMAIFTIEAVLKVYALRRNYFRVAWNIFDFIVVIGTIMVLIIGFLNLGNFAIQSTILRTLRIGRVMRILRRAKKLSIIFNTLVEALPSMASLGMLLLLLMFMYAVIGMSQFGFANITDTENTDYHVNFRNFLNSFLLLFRCATGEAWDSIMFDFGRGYEIMFQCEKEMEYEQYEAAGFISNKCGNKTVAYGFFISFIIFCVQVFLNLFVAVIVDSFGNQAAKADLPIQAIDIEIFCETWREYDGDAKGFIKTTELENLIIDLCNNRNCELIMFRNNIKNKPAPRRKYIANMDIPTFKNFRYFMFYDVLLALIRMKSKYVFEQDFRAMQRMRDSKARELRKAAILSEAQIQRQLAKQFQFEFNGDHSQVIQSFVQLDYTIDLINEIRNTSAYVSKRFKLNKEKADENINEETGASTYYTSRQFVYGSFAVATWRRAVQMKKELAAAAYGEIVNGQRKLIPNEPYSARVKNIPQTIQPNLPEDGADGKSDATDRRTPSARKHKANKPEQAAAILDTDFGGK